MTNETKENDMKTVARWTFGSIGAIATLLVLTWVLTGNDFLLFRMFAPKTEAVRRDVFKQSQAYNDGMANQLSDMQREYATADSAHRVLLSSVIYHRFAAYDARQLPVDLQDFLSTIRRQQLEPK